MDHKALSKPYYCYVFPAFSGALDNWTQCKSIISTRYVSSSLHTT